MSDIQTVKSHVVANLSSLLRIYCEQEEQCRTSCKQLSYPNHWLCYAYIYLSGDQSISLRVPSEEEDDNIDDNFYGVFIDKSVELCCPFRISDRCVASGLIIIVLLLAPICGWKRGSLFFARGRYTAAITFTSVWYFYSPSSGCRASCLHLCPLKRTRISSLV